MPYVMRGRNEAAVYFEHDLPLRATDVFVRAWNHANPSFRVDVFHVVIWALTDALKRYPSMNRFVAGGRLYQRRGVWFSYAVKTRLEVGSPMLVVKRRFDLDDTFGAMVTGMAQAENEVRTGTADRVERELGALLILPGFVRRIVMWAIRTADRLGALPRSYIEHDPMFTSGFLANMASMGMPAVYHHLYEYGSSSIFGSVGRPLAEPGSPTSGAERRRTMNVRWTFDERTEDGLSAWYTLRRIRQIVEDPEANGVTLETIASAPTTDGAAARATDTEPLPDGEPRTRRLWRPSVRQ